jgi:hypothetical protein
MVYKVRSCPKGMDSRRRQFGASNDRLLATPSPEGRCGSEMGLFHSPPRSLHFRLLFAGDCGLKSWTGWANSFFQ